MNTLVNVRCFQAAHKIKPILYIQCSTRTFAGAGEEITRPKDGKYKNVFNKRKSRCGRFTFYTIYPHDYNEPWPFPPVYDKYGMDLNQDPVWGEYGHAISSSITGKPKRALGHYPWLGRPIVPLDDSIKMINDDQVAPYPFFRAGDYEHNRKFIWQMTAMYVIFFFGSWFCDSYWRKNVSMTYYRDKLFFKEQMANDKITNMPLGATLFTNPAAPIVRWRVNKDRWCIDNEWPGLSYRFEQVFVPGAKENMFEDEDPNLIEFKYWPKKSE